MAGSNDIISKEITTGTARKRLVKGEDRRARRAVKAEDRRARREGREAQGSAFGYPSLSIVARRCDASINFRWSPTAGSHHSTCIHARGGQAWEANRRVTSELV